MIPSTSRNSTFSQITKSQINIHHIKSQQVSSTSCNFTEQSYAQIYPVEMLLYINANQRRMKAIQTLWDFFSFAQMDSDLMPPSLSERNLQFHEVSEPWLQAASANCCIRDPHVQQLFKGQTRTNQSQGGFKPLYVHWLQVKPTGFSINHTCWTTWTTNNQKESSMVFHINIDHLRIPLISWATSPMKAHILLQGVLPTPGQMRPKSLLSW